MANYEEMNHRGSLVKMWTRGVPVEDEARVQLRNVAAMPFIHRWVAAMPDVHWGMGATVGSVIPTEHAIIPAAVGVDLGCGMMAIETSASLRARDVGNRIGSNFIARAKEEMRRYHIDLPDQNLAYLSEALRRGQTHQRCAELAYGEPAGAYRGLH